MSSFVRGLFSCSLLCLSLLLAGCGGADEAPSTEAAAPSLSVSVAQPSQRTLAQRVPAAGSVLAWEEMALGVELNGQRVAEVLVEVGDTVQAQQPLLRLDTRTLRMEQRQAAAQLVQAQAQDKVAGTNMKRAAELLERGLIATRDRDEAWSAAEAAKANLASAQAQLANANLRLDFATLRAPDAGQISWRGVQPGQVAMAGGELLRLIRQGRIEWRAEVTERDLIRIAPGTRALLRAADGSQVEGTVRQVSPSLDARSRTALVYVDLPQPGVLRAGMYAQGELLLGELEARTVPSDAVVERDGYRYVFVLGDGDLVEQRRIETGARQDGAVQVLSGLEAGERVAVKGAGFLSDGDRVRVIDASHAAPAAAPATAN
jgi:RND family efflux transporter MFP subunit